MAVRSLSSIQPIIWIPPTYTANYRITVTRADSTVDDITNLVVEGKIVDGVTEGIGTFEIKIPNHHESYNNIWSGMEVVRFYCEYGGGTPTTLRFKGNIEKITHEDYYVTITGRTAGLFVCDQNISKSYEDKDAGYIIKDLFDTYGQSRFDTSSINTSIGTTLNLTFNNTQFWKAIATVCNAVAYDCYIDCNDVIQFFEQNSKPNNGEGIVHNYNMLGVDDFSPDLTQIRNQIRVVGGTVDGVQIIYTANDTTSQTTYGIKREDVYDDGILSFAAAKEYAQYLLNESKNPPTVGGIKGFMLATLQPGESIYLSSPIESLTPQKYRIIKYEHLLTDKADYTKVYINKEPNKLSNVLIESIQRGYEKSNSAKNPAGLDYSMIELFNSDVGTHSNTEVSTGVLKLDSGYTLGTWTSAMYTTETLKNVTQIRISVVGENLPGVGIEVSANNGVTYESVDRDETKTLAASGKNIKIRLTLSGTTTQIDSLSIQYSTES